MAALLESLLLKKVEANKAVEWLKHGQDSDSLTWCKPLKIERQEFVPYLLNFLREQSSSALTHGPATPAKTPSRPGASLPGFSSERRVGCRSTGPGTGSRAASRVQLFSPTPSLSPGAELDTSQTQSESLCFHGASPNESSSFSSLVRSPVPASTFRASPSERRSAQRASLGDFMLSPPDLQQHHQSPSSGVHQQSRGRKRTGMAVQGRQGGSRGGFQTEEAGPARVEVGWRKGRGGGANKTAEPAVSPPVGRSPPPVQLNFNNLDDFPPMQAARASPLQQAKPSRRINPTPVSAERPHSGPKTCFTSTPFSSKPSSPPPVPEALSGGLEGGIPTAQNLNVGSPPPSLQEERELLKKEKYKRANQMCSPLPSSLDPCTPTKAGFRPGSGSKLTPDTQGLCPDPSKVTLTSELDLLADLYCACISENLVPNVFLELFFVLQLLTSRTPAVPEDEDLSVAKSDILERGYLNKVHNCVYFSVRVLDNQFELVSHLDKDTLRLLAENERVSSFSPSLRERLALAQTSSTAKVSASVDTIIHSVPFQPATDNRSNFSSDKAFHTFKKQRDIFYEVLREWLDFHKEPGWEFEAVLGGRVRGMVSQLNSAGNHSHFARLFLKQLMQMCKGPHALGSLGDAPDADLIDMLGADSLGRLKRLEERFIQPQGILGPCPPPSFPGHQEFFRDFLRAASCCQLNQHLKDRLCQQLLQLDEVSILAPVHSTQEGEVEEEGDMEQQNEKQRFSSVLLLARLLAKFLGYVSFLPYQTSERPSREIQEANVALRSKSSSVLDVCAVLRSSVIRRRTVLTVPWLVEFLSMLDYTGPFLLCYRNVLGLLLSLYRRMALSRGGEVCYLNQMLLVAVLGWLFQIPVIPEELFFSSDFSLDAELEESPRNAQGLDGLVLVDQQLLYTCCPFLGEFRKLLVAFVAGSSARGGGLIRKITPTSAEHRGVPTRSQHKLQEDLEQAFFHNQPPSLKRTVEFVAERVGSNCVKHIKATLVCELVRGGEKLLREGLISPGTTPPKLSDSICAQLCDRAQQSLERATRFCSEKGPEAIRVLLPNETSPAVLTTSENITTRLATEKACSWLSSNITALVKREWKTMFDRVKKTSPTETGDVGGAGVGPGTGAGTPERPRTKTKEAITSCPPDCPHSAPLPSVVLVEIKEVLSIAVGPRSEEDVLTVLQLKALLDRVEETLRCRKFSFPKPEQMLICCTVLLACKLVSGELPLCSVKQCSRPQSPGSGAVQSTVQSLLEQLVVLWGKPFVSAPPLHLLFTEITLTGILGASNSEWNNYLFLVTQLVERGILGMEEVVRHWEKLSQLPWPLEFMERIQQCTFTRSTSLPALQKCMDMLQVSHQPVEGAN
ncbi:codanin-1 isoform X2 [Esox lucius]|uniref:codanin-1 isoform X2 n=1 Tax=Esox lucius TaxID=8010 RepID=UPI0014772E1F|nr:codanin-1 isoform X2 [Esox lucius]